MTAKRKKPAIHDQIVPEGFIEKEMKKSANIAERMKATKFGTADHAKLARELAKVNRAIFNALDKDSNYRGGNLHQLARHAATVSKTYVDTIASIAARGIQSAPMADAVPTSVTGPWFHDETSDQWRRVFIAPSTSRGVVAARVTKSKKVEHWDVNWNETSGTCHATTAKTRDEGMLHADAGLAKHGTYVPGGLPPADAATS